MQKKLERRAISAGELYVILDREFRLRQSRECRGCYILLPYRIDNHGSGANWEIVLPPSCPHGCAEVIAELVDEAALKYDITNGNGD
jgi:hypothetical protein